MKGRNTMGIWSVLAVLTLALNSGVQAASSECKGMEQNSCIQAKACRWVNSYQRSNGKKVSGYCRKLPRAKKQVEVVDATTPANS